MGGGNDEREQTLNQNLGVPTAVFAIPTCFICRILKKKMGVVME